MLPVWLTRVQSRSMEPTLRDGQLVWTRAVGGGHAIERGDLVVADSTELNRRIIKRVIGLPLERVDIRAGIVSVNGVELVEPGTARVYFDGSYQVPAGSYLLLGDNRAASSDSRSWQQPYVNRNQLRGLIRQPAGTTDHPTPDRSLLPPSPRSGRRGGRQTFATTPPWGNHPPRQHQ